MGDSAKPWRYYDGSFLQKTGHGSIVETVDGEVYVAHLCSRPYTPELRSVLGREAGIQKCEWTDDGWIRLKSKDNMAKLEVEELNNIDTDNLEIDCLENSLQSTWYTLREPICDSWAKVENDTITLRGRESLFSNYNQSLLAKKVRGFHASTSVKVEFIPDNFLQMAGLVNYYNSSAFYYFRIYYSESLGGIALGVMKSEQGMKEEYKEYRVLLEDYQGSVFLKSEVIEKVIKFYYSIDGNEWIDMKLELDSTILSDECAQGFTGSMVGITAQDLYTKSKKVVFSRFHTSNM